MNTPTPYCLRVRGHLDLDWSEWFDGLAIAHEPNGETTLTGVVLDQAALHGLIAKVRDLGLELVAVVPDPRSGAGTDETSEGSPDAAPG